MDIFEFCIFFWKTCDEFFKQIHPDITDEEIAVE
jgi:hypothetical protein